MADYQQVRREYGQASINLEDLLHNSPLKEISNWIDDALKDGVLEPNAAVLSTITTKAYPDSRVVLIKKIDDNGLIFYTNYLSAKALEIANQPIVALNFYWRDSARQIRLKGKCSKISEKESKEYFYSRPFASQVASSLSKQSQEITSLSELELQVKEKIKEGKIDYPKHWGGYCITPCEIEFYQGRDDRLSERILCCFKNGEWKLSRLAP